MKKNIKYILVFFGLFIFSYLSINMRISEINYFGISTNILKGRMPYRDIAYGITPLYSFFMSLLLVINKSYLMYIIMSSVIGTLIIYVIDLITKKGSSLFVAFILICSRPSPFLLILLLLLIIIRMELEKLKYYKIRFDYLIGFIAGCIFLINQVIGIFIIINIFITDKNKVNRFLGLVIPLLIFLNYLFITGSFTPCIGMLINGTFNMFNIKFSVYLILAIILVVALFVEKIRMKNYPNNSKLLSIALIFSLSMFMDNTANTLFMSLTLALLYFLLAYKNLENNFYVYLVGYAYLILLVIFIIINLIFNKPVFVTDLDYFKYILLDHDSYIYMKDINNSINKYKDYDIYIINDSSYLFKLNSGLEFSKCDLINKKDMSNKLSLDYINDIKSNCSNKTCIFYLVEDDDKNYLINNNIISFIKNNYGSINDFYNFNIYSNKTF